MLVRRDRYMRYEVSSLYDLFQLDPVRPLGIGSEPTPLLRDSRAYCLSLPVRVSAGMALIGLENARDVNLKFWLTSTSDMTWNLFLSSRSQGITRYIVMSIFSTFRPEQLERLCLFTNLDVTDCFVSRSHKPPVFTITENEGLVVFLPTIQWDMRLYSVELHFNRHKIVMRRAEVQEECSMCLYTCGHMRWNYDQTTGRFLFTECFTLRSGLDSPECILCTSFQLNKHVRRWKQTRAEKRFLMQCVLPVPDLMPVVWKFL